METFLSVLIMSLLIGAIGVIYNIIKYATLGSEFKNLNKVLLYFGNTKSQEWKVTQIVENETITKKEIFTPKELALFLRKKTEKTSEWKNREYDLYLKVKEEVNTSTEASQELYTIQNKAISVFCPKDWEVHKTTCEGHYPLITCDGVNGSSFSVRLEDCYWDLKHNLDDYVKILQEGRSKFISKQQDNIKFRDKDAISYSYAFKDGEDNCFGYVLIYAVDNKHDILFNSYCKKDWSYLCSKLHEIIMNNIEYDKDYKE